MSTATNVLTFNDRYPNYLRAEIAKAKAALAKLEPGSPAYQRQQESLESWERELEERLRTDAEFAARQKKQAEEARAKIVAFQREIRLDWESAKQLYKYRFPSEIWPTERLSSHEEEFCEALEKKLAEDKATRVVAARSNGGSSGNGIDWDAHDAARKARQPQPAEAPPQQPRTEPPPPLPFISTATWDSEPVPQQQWTVLNRIPRRQVALFSGEGAAGKSTIQLQLSAAHVLGKEWLGTLPEQGPALFIDAEDDVDVLHRRLAAIAKHHGATFADLSGLHLISLVGRDAVMATASRSGKIEPTPLYKQILDAAGAIKPVTIGIASSANVFAGSELDRNQVQQFISLLTGLAIAANGSVMLISHPSLAGIANDTGLSGNTQWHNAVRARCYLKSVKPDAGEQADSDLREIVLRKQLRPDL